MSLYNIMYRMVSGHSRHRGPQLKCRTLHSQISNGRKTNVRIKLSVKPLAHETLHMNALSVTNFGLNVKAQ